MTPRLILTGSILVSMLAGGGFAAAQTPAHTSDDANQVLYELAEALESVGEVARALAICLELQAEAGDYKDISARVDRLAKVQTRG